jgi:hypothetical protein
MAIGRPALGALQEAIESLRRLRGTAPIPERGHGWQEPAEAWFRLVCQICAIGSSRAWEVMDTAAAREGISILRIRAEGADAPAYVHTVLAQRGIRYCSSRSQDSAKARAIALNASSPFVADGSGTVCLLDRVRETVGTPVDDGVLTPEQAKEARGLGLADSLLAFDVRLLNLLIGRWGLDPAWRNRMLRLHEYEELEAEISMLLCIPLRIRPVELDRLLFYGYPTLRRAGRNAREQTDRGSVSGSAQSAGVMGSSKEERYVRETTGGCAVERRDRLDNGAGDRTGAGI